MMAHCFIVFSHLYNFMHIKSSVGLLLSACMLVSCLPGESNVPNIAPEEVLRRSADASRTLQSATFNGSADIKIERQDAGTVVSYFSLDGALQDSGQKLHLVVDGAVAGGTPEKPIEGEGKLEIIAARNSDLFFFLHSLKMTDAQSAFSPSMIETIVGSWWHMPVQQQDGIVSITPDPSLLKAQAEVVKVTEDHGIDTLDGEKAFHYDVAIEPELLVDFLRKVSDDKGEEFKEEEVRKTIGQTEMTGSLWIDINTYYVHRLEWNIVQNIDDSESPKVTIIFELDMRNQNKADPIVIPEDAKEFSPFVLIGGAEGLGQKFPVLDDFPSIDDSGLGENPLEEFDGMTPEQQQQLLQQLLNGGGMPSLP